MPPAEEVQVTAGSVVLAGTLTLPDETPTRWPAVLLVPSWLPRDRHGRHDRRRHRGWFAAGGPPRSGILARLADALAVRGVASLRCDKRGCGRSGGTWAATGFFTLVDDVRDALAVLRGHPAVDPARVGIVGHGEGGALALSVAAADPAIGPLTLIGAPARGLRDVLRRAASERARRTAHGWSPPRHPFLLALDRGLEELVERAERGEPTMTLRLSRTRWVRLALAGWEQAMAISPRALATLQRRSVTLVHGGADEWVDPEEGSLLQAALEATAAPARIVVPGAGHDLAEAAPEVFRDLAADLAARLQARRLPAVLMAVADAPPPARPPPAGLR